MKILITGIHGFVGSNLVTALSKDNDLYGLDIIAPTKEGVVKTFSWDDLKTDSVPEVDAIIHLAGKAHDIKKQSATEVYYKVNTELTKTVFDYFLAHNSIKKFLFFSTAKAAADKVDGVLTEDVVPAPVGPYGESKIAAEEYILKRIKEFNGLRVQEEFQDPNSDVNQQDNLSSTTLVTDSKLSEFRFQRSSKNVYIFRPCMIHGPGNKGNLNLLYNIVKKGIPWPLGAFENRRTFTSVQNICFVVNGVLTKNVPSGIYNVGDDDALSTNELIEEICRSLGKKAHIWRIPKGIMNGIATVGGWLHLPLNAERLRKLTESYISSNEKIKKVLGVTKMPVEAHQGLQYTLDSFNAKNN